MRKFAAVVLGCVFCISSILAGDAPATAPTITSPTGSGNGTTPEFDWNATDNTDFYDLWVDSLTTGQSQVIRSQEITATTFQTIEALADNSAYRAWVRSGNAYGFSAWSAAQDFATGAGPIASPTGAPTMTAPAGAGNINTPVFTWTSLSGARGYDLWVDDLTTATSQAIRQQTLTGTTFTPTTALTDGHSYRSWIRASNEFGFSNWSVALDFGVTTAPVAPPTVVPTLTAPTGAGNTTTPTFTWNSVSDASSYDLWTDDLTSGATQVIRNTSLTGTSFTPTTALTDNHAYRAWIRASNVFGSGAWSQPQDFGVGTAPIVAPTGVPTVTAPTGTNNNLLPEFQWSAVDGANRFDLWVDDLTANVSQVIRQQSITGLSYTATVSLADNHVFRTWARAGNEFGFGAWSAAVDFGTGNAYITPPTDVPVLSAPIGSNIALTPTFSWSASAGATGYDFWLDDETTNVSQVIRMPALTTTSFVPGAPLTPLHAYRWWVRGTNVIGTSSWSSAGDFTTTAGLTVSAQGEINVQATDANGAIVIYPAVTVIDSADPAPVVSYSRNSGTLFPIGRTTIYVLVLDDSGNHAETSFDVVVSAISIFPPTDMFVPATDENGTVVNYTAKIVDVFDPAPQVTYSVESGTVFPLGTTTVYINAVDSLNNSTFASFNVYVNPIEITQPQDISVTATDPNGAFVDFPEPVISDFADPNPTWYFDFPPESFPIGVTTVSVFAFDGIGNAATASFNVIVTSPITITPPADIIVPQGILNGGAVVTYADAAVTDLVEPFPTVTYSQDSGSVFSNGTTSVLITVTDGAGFNVTSSFNVTVTPAFVITPPADITVTATGADAAVVNYPKPLIFDLNDVNPTLTYSQNSGTSFPVGVTVVTITGADVWGVTASATFMITVNSPITIDQPADIAVFSNDPAGTIVDFPALSVADPADPTPAITYSPASGTVFSPGTTPVTVTVTDAADNIATATFNVVVNTLVITPPADVTVPATGNNSAVVTFTATIQDSADASPTVTYSQASGTHFPVGKTTVVIDATDSVGNAAEVSFSVTVTSPITITPPATVSVQTTFGPSVAVDLPAAVVVDTLDATPVVSYSPVTDSNFAIGITTVTILVTDALGNTATSNFNVFVSNTLAVIPPSDVTVEATSTTGAVATYDAATITDPADGSPVVLYSQASGTNFPVGTTVVTVTVGDVWGNAAMATFNVNVTSPLLISPPADVTVYSADPTGALIHYEDASVSDELDPTPVLSYSIPNDSQFPIGDTTVTVLATDVNGFTATTSFGVHVLNVLRVTGVANMTVLATDANGAVVNFAAPTVYDPLDASPAIAYSIASGSTFPVGYTVVTVSATDSFGSTASVQFVVNVVYFTVVPPSDLNVSTANASGAVVSYASATINTLVDLPITLTYSSSSGSLFPLGLTQVTVTATDGAGDLSVGAFNVNVHSLTVTQPDSLVMEATDATGATVTYPPATVTDLFDPYPAVTYSQDSGTTFHIGVTPVTVTAINVLGDTVTATFTVTVQDTTAPAIAAIPDVKVFNSPDGAVVHFPQAIASDNGTTAPTITYSTPSGSTFPAGSSTVVVTATDKKGNSTTSVINVIVSADNTGFVDMPPVIADLVPNDGAFVETTPTFSASYFNDQTGIDETQTIVTLDGTDITTQAVVGANAFSFTPATPLSEGIKHRLTISVTSVGGHTTTATTNVTPNAIKFDRVAYDGAIHSPAQIFPEPTDRPLTDYIYKSYPPYVFPPTPGEDTTPSITGTVSSYPGTFTPTITAPDVITLVTSDVWAPGKFNMIYRGQPGDSSIITGSFVDDFGNVTSKSVAAIIDMPFKSDLGLTFSYKRTSSSGGDFSGQVGLKYVIGTTVSITIDGASTDVSVNKKTGAFTLHRVGLAEGKHSAYATATHGTLIERSDSIAFKIDFAPPGTVTVDGPSDLLTTHEQFAAVFLKSDDGKIHPNGFTSPGWYTGTITDALSGTASMGVGYGSTLNGAVLDKRDTAGKSRWMAPIDFSLMRNTITSDYPVGSFGFSAADLATNTATGSVTPSAFMLPILLAPGADYVAVQVQKGDSILVGSFEYSSTCEEATGTGYVRPMDRDTATIGFRAGDSYSFGTKLLCLKYDDVGLQTVVLESVNPDLPQSSSLHVIVWDLPLQLLDSSDTPINAVGPILMNVDPSRSLSQTRKDNPNLIKMVLHKPTNGSTPPANDENVKITVVTPFSGDQGGNARILWENPATPGTLTPLNTKTLTVGDIGSGLTVYVQATAGSLMPGDVSVIVDFTPKPGLGAQFIKPIRQVVSFTIVQVEFVTGDKNGALIPIRVPFTSCTPVPVISASVASTSIIDNTLIVALNGMVTDLLSDVVSPQFQVQSLEVITVDQQIYSSTALDNSAQPAYPWKPNHYSATFATSVDIPVTTPGEYMFQLRTSPNAANNIGTTTVLVNVVLANGALKVASSHVQTADFGSFLPVMVRLVRPNMPNVSQYRCNIFGADWNLGSTSFDNSGTLYALDASGRVAIFVPTSTGVVGSGAGDSPTNVRSIGLGGWRAGLSWTETGEDQPGPTPRVTATAPQNSGLFIGGIKAEDFVDPDPTHQLHGAALQLAISTKASEIVQRFGRFADGSAIQIAQETIESMMSDSDAIHVYWPDGKPVPPTFVGPLPPAKYSAGQILNAELKLRQAVVDAAFELKKAKVLFANGLPPPGTRNTANATYWEAQPAGRITKNNPFGQQDMWFLLNRVSTTVDVPGGQATLTGDQKDVYLAMEDIFKHGPMYGMDCSMGVGVIWLRAFTNALIKQCHLDMNKKADRDVLDTLLSRETFDSQLNEHPKNFAISQTIDWPYIMEEDQFALLNRATNFAMRVRSRVYKILLPGDKFYYINENMTYLGKTNGNKYFAHGWEGGTQSHEIGILTDLVNKDPNPKYGRTVPDGFRFLELVDQATAIQK